MTTAASVTNLNALFKTQYVNTLMKESVADKVQRPFLSLLKDSKSIEKNSMGRGLSFPVVYERPATSSTFTTAQTNGAPGLVKEFNPTVVGHIYSPFQISVDAILRAKGDKAAFMGMVEFATKQHSEACADAIEECLFASGAGEMAVVQTSATGTSLVITNDDDVWKFKVGDELVFATSATATLKSQSVTVTALAASGVITVDALSAIDGGSGVVAGDYVFREGTAYNNSANPLPTGLLAYATSGTIHGLDNSTHYRLRIPTVTGSLSDPVAAIQSAQMLLQKFGPLGRANVCFVPWAIWATIAQSMDDKDQTKPGGLGEQGYTALRVVGPNGPVDILGSRFVQAKTMWLVDPKTLKLCHIGEELIDLEKTTGQVLKFRDAADAVEGRISSRLQLVCTTPAANARITLS